MVQKPGLGTEARLLPDVLLTTDSWNTLVRPGPNVSVMNQTQQQSIRTRIRDRRISIFGHVHRDASARISTSAWSTQSYCQLPCRSPTWWQTGVETSSRSSPTNLDPPAGDRCRSRCRCCLGDGWWSRRLEGATTYGRSSGLVSEWVSEIAMYCQA